MLLEMMSLPTCPNPAAPRSAWPTTMLMDCVGQFVLLLLLLALEESSAMSAAGAATPEADATGAATPEADADAAPRAFFFGGPFLGLWSLPIGVFW